MVLSNTITKYDITIIEIKKARQNFQNFVDQNIVLMKNLEYLILNSEEASLRVIGVFKGVQNASQKH